MFVGEITCPNPTYHFRMYYNELACKNAMVLKSYTTNLDGAIVPGLIGKLVFTGPEEVRPGVVGREVCKMIEIYAELINLDNIVADKKEFDYLLNWFSERIWALHNAALQSGH